MKRDFLIEDFKKLIECVCIQENIVMSLIDINTQESSIVQIGEETEFAVYNHDEEIKNAIYAKVVGENKEQLLEKLSLKNIVNELEKKDTFNCQYKVKIGDDIARIEFSAMYFDRENGMISANIREVTNKGQHNDTKNKIDGMCRLTVDREYGFFSYIYSDGGDYELYAINPLFEQFDKGGNHDETIIGQFGGLINVEKYDEYVEHLMLSEIKKQLEETDKYLYRVQLNLEDKLSWYEFSVSYADSTKRNMVLACRSIQNIVEYEGIREKIKSIYEDEIRYDKVTGLLNYEYFQELMINMVEAEPEEKYYIINCDISNFKDVNKVLGSKKGNEILNEFGQILSMCCAEEEECIVGRIHADNFIKVFRYNDKIKDREYCFDQIVKYISNIQAPHVNLDIKVAAGVSIINNGVSELEMALEYSNVARKIAKTFNESKLVLYNDELAAQIAKQETMEANIKKALQNKKFIFYLQPKVNIINNTIIGAEALSRWIDEDGNMLNPGQFIPIMEKNGSIVKLDFIIYEKVCVYLKDRIDNNLPVFPISLNVSRANLEKEDFAEEVHSLISGYNIAPRLIEFELTESIFRILSIDDIEILKRFQNWGYTVSIDDFGSGYSSLYLLTKVKFDVLKLDKTFIDDYMKDNSKIVISNFVRMAKDLGMVSLCEGVEDVEQVEFLKNIGCDVVQGFYYSRPIPPEEFDQEMKAYF